MPTVRGRDPRVEVTRTSIKVRLNPDAVDRLALDFCKVLVAQKVPYAIVSGYVAILLGRNRLSEDIDLFTEELSLARFRRLHSALLDQFECVTPGSAERLFHDYLSMGSESTSVRFAHPGSFAPNVEVKFARKPTHHYSMDRRWPVSVNGQRVYIGSLEMGIAFKVKMGTEKDLADARWIFDRTKHVLDQRELRRLMEELDAHAKWIS